MRRSVLFSFAIAWALGCGGYGYEARTTTITGAPMMTSGPGIGERELPRTLRSASERMAQQVCTHENRCGRGSVSECASATLPRVTEELTRWNCEPAAIRARLEECLAGIDELSCDAVLSNKERTICPANDECHDRMVKLISPGPELAKIWR
ncbi:MAG TPA: DUF6184 family natural product biosynthesis lipoprotein [Labilithrix sp.]|nr:DUF6184 family natural product biosynthesis lipoprotein [Labilithrix sp.]